MARMGVRITNSLSYGENMLHDLGTCICGKKIQADDTYCFVTHELPFCKLFEELEVEEFLTTVRKSREN